LLFPMKKKGLQQSPHLSEENGHSAFMGQVLPALGFIYPEWPPFLVRRPPLTGNQFTHRGTIKPL